MAEVHVPIAFARRNEFPMFCVKTGETAHHKYTYIAHSKTPAWVYGLLVLGFVPGLIAIMLLHQTLPHVRLELPINGRDARKRALLPGLKVGGIVAGLAMMGYGAVQGLVPVAVGGVAFVGFELLVGLLSSRKGIAAQVRGDRVMFQRVHPKFANATQVAGWAGATDGTLAQTPRARVRVPQAAAPLQSAWEAH